MKKNQRPSPPQSDFQDQLEKYKDALMPYAGHIALGVVAIVVLGAIYSYYNSAKAKKSELAWSEFYSAFSQREAKELENVAEMQSGRPALWAQQAAANLQLSRGAMGLYRDRENAKEELASAKKNFEEVIAQADDGFLKRRAMFGLAQVYESLSDAKKARDLYAEIAKLEADSALGKQANERFNTLAKKSEEQWLAWFEKQKYTPPAPGEPFANPHATVQDTLTTTLEESSGMDVPESFATDDVNEMLRGGILGVPEDDGDPSEGTETPMEDPGPEPKPEAPAEPKPEAPTEPKPEAPAEPKPEAPAEPKPEAPAEPKPEAPAEPKPEAPAEPKPEAPAEPKPEAPAEPKPEAPAEPKPEAPAEPKPE